MNNHSSIDIDDLVIYLVGYGWGAYSNNNPDLFAHELTQAILKLITSQTTRARKEARISENMMWLRFEGSDGKPNLDYDNIKDRDIQDRIKELKSKGRI